MNAEEITLNISVNLNRIARWSMEGREKRVAQFLDETKLYINELEKTPKSDQFTKTFKRFQKEFTLLSSSQTLSPEWTESISTWSNILQHRAKLS